MIKRLVKRWLLKQLRERWLVLPQESVDAIARRVVGDENQEKIDAMRLIIRLVERVIRDEIIKQVEGW